MQILDLSDISDGSPFSIRRIIIDNNKYFAEIQPLKTKYKIVITKGDYKNILDAYHLNKIVKIYPFEGKIDKDNEIIQGDYKIEVS